MPLRMPQAHPLRYGPGIASVQARAWSPPGSNHTDRFTSEWGISIRSKSPGTAAQIAHSPLAFSAGGKPLHLIPIWHRNCSCLSGGEE